MGDLRMSRIRIFSRWTFFLLLVFLLAGFFAMKAAALETHTHDDVVFEEWTDSASLPLLAGNHYLTGDVTLDGTWSCPSGIVGLCLNGHSITLASDSGSAVSVKEGTTLTLYDCAGSVTSSSAKLTVTVG